MDGSTSLRRIAALSVAITLFTAPIASAQSPEAARSSASPNDTTLLSPAAFARLVQPTSPDAAPAPVVADSPRPSLLRQGTAAVAREARATATKAPQQQSWASRHKKALIWTTIAVAAGLIFLSTFFYVAYHDE
jgi:hypothetical protein